MRHDFTRWELKKAIHRSGHTYKQIVEKLKAEDLSLSESALGRIVTGNRDKVDTDVQDAIARILNVDAKQIFDDLPIDRIHAHFDDSGTESKTERQFLKILWQKEDDYVSAIYDVIMFYGSVEKPEKASAYYEVLIQETDDLEQKALQYLEKGRLMERQNNYQMACKFYAQALPLEPRNKGVWFFINNNLGYALNQCGEYVRAEEYCRAAIRIEPNRYNAHKNLGISLEGQREYHQAIKAYVEAIKREPLDPRALVHLEDLMDREPYLSIEDPGLEGVLGRCQRWVARFRGEDWREE